MIVFELLVCYDLDILSVLEIGFFLIKANHFSSNLSPLWCQCQLDQSPLPFIIRPILLVCWLSWMKNAGSPKPRIKLLLKNWFRSKVPTPSFKSHGNWKTEPTSALSTMQGRWEPLGGQLDWRAAWWGWGAGSAGKVLAAQAWGPEVGSSTPTSESRMVEYLNPMLGGMVGK